MVTKEQLLEKKAKAQLAVGKLVPGAKFDHFGLKVPDSKTAEALVGQWGVKCNEITQSGRRVVTVAGPFGTFEILEPKSTETITEAYVDHIAYQVEDPSKLQPTFSEIVGRFDIGNAQGFIAKVDNDLIEFRTTPILDFRFDV